MKHFFLFSLILISGLSLGQRVVSLQTTAIASSRYQDTLAENVIFYDGFENSATPNLSSGWTSQSLANEGFIAGTGGSSPGQANENGFWAVPLHGIFAMSNDDVCNCNKSKDRLTSPIIDLLGNENLNLRFSAFQNGSGGQTAKVEVRAQGKPWTPIGDIVNSSIWRDYSFSIPRSFISTSFQFRFLYDDAGNYASGIAIDDVYLIDEISEEFSFRKFYSIEGNDFGSGQLFETIPLSQARAAKFEFGACIDNKTSSRKNARINAQVSGPLTYNQTSSNWMVGANQKKTIYLPSSEAFTPYELGVYTIEASIESDSADLDLTDNAFSTSFSVVDSVYRHVEATAENSTGIWIQGSGDRYGNVFYFHETDSIKAMKIRIHPSSEVGAKFKVEIFRFDSINQSPSYISNVFEVAEENIGVDFRLPLNIEITEGKHLVTLKKEPGPRRLIVGASRNKEALDSNVIYQKSGEEWKQLSYFPKSSLIFKSIDTSCIGHIQYTLISESCSNSDDGSISLTVFGMTGTENYAWSNTAGNTSTISNLAPGAYTVTVSDDTPCFYSKTFRIDSASSLKVNPIVFPDSCGGNTGSVDLNISSGQEPYLINWNSETLGSAEYNLAKGDYQIQLLDFNDCALDTLISIPGSDSLIINFTTIEPNCLTSDGQINAVISGSSPFIYSWSNGSTNNLVQNLAAGIYSLQISDSIGCVGSASVVLKNANAPTVVVSQADTPICYGEASGAIDLTVFGGIAPYSYNWSNGATTEELTNLLAGIYTITVSDDASCLNFAYIDISESPDPLEVNFNSKGVYCNDDSSGASQAIVRGGNKPYSYNWSTGSQTKGITDLISGSYDLTITDDDGCEKLSEVSIASGVPFFVTLDSVIRDTAGSIIPKNKIYITSFGGTDPHTFIWNDSIQSEDLINIPSGGYALKVTDQLGCVVFLEYLLENGPANISDVEEKVFFTIYPNPASGDDLLKIKSSESISEMIIYDISGRILLSNRHQSKAAEIQLNGYSPGVYFIKIQTPSGHQIKPFIIN